MFPLVHSNRHLLNGGVILRIYYIRVMRNIYKSSSRFKKEIASIDLFIYFFLSTGWKSEWIIEFDLFRAERMKTGRATRGSIAFLGWSGFGWTSSKGSGMCTGRFKMWVSAVDSSLVFVHFTVHLESSFYRVSEFVHTISISILTSISRFFSTRAEIYAFFNNNISREIIRIYSDII